MKIYSYDKIKVGDVYKSYRQLCEVLNADEMGGNQKKSQLKEWECHFSYVKQGNKFIITEIFETPKEKEDNRTGGNNRVKYIDEIEKLIIDLLLTKGTGETKSLFISKGKLFKELNMINGFYSYGKMHKGYLSNKTEVNMNVIDDFYSMSDSMLQRNVESALNSLRNKAIAMWSHATTIISVETNIQANHWNNIRVEKIEEIDQYGDIKVSFEEQVVKTKQVHKKANEFEQNAILDAEGLFLDKYKCKSIQEVIIKGKGNDFYSEVKEYLLYNYNILNYYSSYEITFNKDRAEMEQKELEELILNKLVKDETLIKLNSDVAKQLENNATNRHENAERKFKDTNKTKYKVRMSNDYIQNSKTLINKLILPQTEENS